MASWCSTISAWREWAPRGRHRPFGIWSLPQYITPIPASFISETRADVIVICGLSMITTQISDRGISASTASPCDPGPFSRITSLLSLRLRCLGLRIVTVCLISGPIC